MATRKQREPAESGQVRLSRKRDAAAQEIAEQLAKGRDIFTELEMASSPPALTEVRERVDRWVSYTTDLLRLIFSTSALADEFEGKTLIGSFHLSPTFQDMKEELRIDLRGYLNRLESINERLNLYPEPENVETRHKATGARSVSNKVFIVHGHDVAIQQEAARLVERLGFEAVILAEQSDGGRTLIEKLEYYSEAAYAIVLFTPDDEGSVKTKSDERQGRARQNVVLEYGLFLGLLKRERVRAVCKMPIELPSDISGVLYTRYDDQGAWKYQVAKEMQAAGLNVDMNKV